MDHCLGRNDECWIVKEGMMSPSLRQNMGETHIKIPAKELRWNPNQPICSNLSAPRSFTTLWCHHSCAFQILCDETYLMWVRDDVIPPVPDCVCTQPDVWLSTSSVVSVGRLRARKMGKEFHILFQEVWINKDCARQFWTFRIVKMNNFLYKK